MISLTPRSLIEQQKQRNNLLYGEFILNLDKQTIDHIKNQFQQELTLTQFTNLLKRFTKWWNPKIKNKDEVIKVFAKTMFESATHCESLKVSFEQWTKYIIRKMTTLKSIKPQTWEIPFIKPSFKLEGYQNINKAIYLPFMKAVCFFQQSSNIIYFFDPIKCQLILKPLVVGKKKEKKNELYTKQQTLTNTILLNMIVIQVQNLPVLLTSTNDRKVRGWSLGPCSFQQANYPDTRCDAIIQKFTEQVYTMNWDPINQIVYCGFKNGGISLWKINMNIVKSIPHQNNSMIMCMVALPRLYMLATGGIDGKVILWNIAAQERKWVYKQHTRGVLALAYNQPTFQLFSAGFDHQICIWNPYTSHLINKIQIHQNPIISLSLANNNLISLDCFGNIKVTNIKKSTTLLTYNTEVKQPGGIFYLKQQNKLTIYGQSMITLDYQTNYNAHLTDNSTPINCYLLSNTEIVSVSNEIIKIWSLLTGSLLRTVIIPLQNITSSLVFEHGIILGDQKGNLIFASLYDQPQFKKLPKHSNQINYISCLQTQKQQIKRIIVASTEIHILIHLNNKFEILNSIKHQCQQIISIEYHFPSKSILAGTNTGVILIYTEQLVLRQQMVISDCLISSVRFLNNQTLAVSFDNMLYIMSMSPNLMQTENIKAITNKSRVSTLSIFEYNLFVGFQKGRIQCYNKESMDLKYQIKGHHDAVIFINIIQEHDIFVTGGADRMIKIWKIDSGQYIDQFQQDIKIIQKVKKLGDQMVYKATQQKILIQKLKNSYPQIARRSLQTKYLNNWNLFINFERQKSQKKISLKQVEIENTTTPKIILKQRSSTSLFVKRTQSQKQRCSSIKSQINLKLKSNAQKRRISEQKLQRIEIQAKRSVDKQLQKIQKTRSRSNKPFYYLSQKQNKSIQNMQNMQNFYRKTKINIKTNAMEKRKFSRSFFPNSSTKPVGSKFPKLI